MYAQHIDTDIVQIIVQWKPRVGWGLGEGRHMGKSVILSTIFLKSWAINLIRASLCVMSFLAASRFSLCFWFSVFLLHCIWMWFSAFILFGLSWVYRKEFSINLKSCQPLFILILFSSSFSPLPLELWLCVYWCA